jgi:SAM-dependent methyltransferase
MKAGLGLQFVQGHFNDFLARNQRRFDAVFCNHVLEHVYEPEVTLGLIRCSLKPGGHLVAGLPMEGCPDGLFARAMRRMAAAPSALHIMDVGILDAGHAWKTNPPDLKATLEGEGFMRVELYLRQPANTMARRAVGLLLYASTFGLARRAFKLLPSGVIPDMLVRAFLAAERRCWFGANRLKNRFAKEVLVVGKVYS